MFCFHNVIDNVEDEFDAFGSHLKILEIRCTNLPDIDDGLIAKPKVPKTANGSDERYFDEQEYEEMSKKYNSQ